MKRLAFPWVWSARGRVSRWCGPRRAQHFAKRRVRSWRRCRRHTREVDAELAEVGEVGPEEVGDTGADLVGRDLGETDAGVVVDRDMNVVRKASRQVDHPRVQHSRVRLREKHIP